MFYKFLIIGFFLSIYHYEITSSYDIRDILILPSFLLPQNRIIGGEARNIRDIQYQVSLWNGTHHFCGAALISETWAITAAHCLKKYPDIYVRVNSSDSTTGGQVVKVLKELTHPEYDEMLYDFDVGLLKLAPFNSNNIRFARFKKCAKRRCHTGDFIIVSGWGVNEITDPLKKNILQSVRLELVNQRVCYNTFKKTFDVTDRMLCAGYSAGGKDSCQGDSGGPVTCKGDLIAVVSAGFACAKANTPGLYTNLQDEDIREWIGNEIGNKENCFLQQIVSPLVETPAAEKSPTNAAENLLNSLITI